MLSYFLLGIAILLLYSFVSPITIPFVLLSYFILERRRKVFDDDLEVVIIGAGISGITMGKSLNDIGLKKYTILEQGSGVGGTWFWNKFPGCCSDVIAKLYSFSWHYNPAWTKRFPGSDELQEYILDAASQHNIFPHIQFNKSVVKCEWKEKDGKWKVDTSDGVTYHANVLINATGILHIPVIPKIEGDQNFNGTKLHTGRWDKNIDLKDKNIGLIGTGCTAVQVLPAIIDECKKVTLFQRTPAWVFPKGQVDYDDADKSGIVKFFKDLYERLKGRFEVDWMWLSITTKNAWYTDTTLMPAVQGMMEATVEDPEMKKYIIPDFEVGVKRPVFTDDYLQAFNKSNFKLVTDPIQKVTNHGIETKARESIPLDVIIYATGFDSLKSALPFEVIGTNGQSLKDLWGRSPRAYKAICVPKMPNYFIMFGPNSIHDRMLMSECAAVFVADAVLKLSRSGKKSMTIKEELYEEYNNNLKQTIQGKTFGKTAGGYYVNGEGFNWLLYPYSMHYYIWQTWGCSTSEFDWN